MQTGQEKLKLFPVLISYMTFSPSTVIEWNELFPNIWSSSSLIIFKEILLSFMQIVNNIIFEHLNPNGMRFVTRLKKGLTHLW